MGLGIFGTGKKIQLKRALTAVSDPTMDDEGVFIDHLNELNISEEDIKKLVAYRQDFRAQTGTPKPASIDAYEQYTAKRQEEKKDIEEEVGEGTEADYDEESPQERALRRKRDRSLL